MVKVQGEQIARICHRRLYAGQSFDAVIVGYYDGEKLIFAAKVRNGFVPRLRREVWQKLKDWRPLTVRQPA